MRGRRAAMPLGQHRSENLRPVFAFQLDHVDVPPTRSQRRRDGRVLFAEGCEVVARVVTEAG